MLTTKTKKQAKTSAFTIIELLVVIVVIGILASITIVSYIGVVQKTKVASLKADLSTSAQRIKLFQVDNDFYPHQINDCPSPATTNLCLTPSNNSTYDYTVNNSTNPQSFTLIATADDGITKYQITEGGGITEVAAIEAADSFVGVWGGFHIDGGIANYASDDGYIMVGQTHSFGAGGYDAFLTKLNSDGSLDWSRIWGGLDDDGIERIVELDDGYIVAGFTYSYGQGNSDAFIAKLTFNGDLLWMKTWGGSEYDIAHSVIKTADGGYIISGETMSYGFGGTDAFIAKFTADGTLSWNSIWGAGGADYGYQVIETQDGGYALTGLTTSYGAGGYDSFLLKFTSNGVLSWARTWGGGNFDAAYCLIQDDLGDFVIAGRTESYGAGDEDGVLIKIDANGNFIWNRTWGGLEYESLTSITQHIDGGYIVTGRTESFGVGNSDAYITKFSSSGNHEWSRTWGGDQYEVSYSIKSLPDGKIIIGGATASYGVANGDAFIAKYSSDGYIDNCSFPMCQSPMTTTTTNPAATFSSQSATYSSPLVTSISSPNLSVSSPPATYSILVSP